MRANWRQIAARGMKMPTAGNTLYYGDNLTILREEIADESVDLIYLDPPFNSNASYNVLFRAPEGHQSKAQIEAFDDTWHWNESAEEAFDAVMKSKNSQASEMLRAMRAFLGMNDMMAYLAMMAVRLLELHRVLKPTGSLYLHCDPTASHYLKILLDAVFGKAGFRTAISWKRSSAHNDAKQGRVQYGNIRDEIFFYTKSDSWNWNWQYTAYDEDYTASAYRQADEDGRMYRRGDLTASRPGGDVSYNWPVKRLKKGKWQADIDDEFKSPKPDWDYRQVPPYKRRFWAYSRANMAEMAAEGRLIYASSGMPEYKRYLDEMPGVPLQNDWNDILPVSGKERLGYPTQKPVALLERIIASSSNEKDVVLDPFCGCGTTIHAAQKLKRKWIGIDVTHLAVHLVQRRIKDAFSRARFDIHGVPQDLDGARALALKDKYEFQKWALSVVEAQPYRGGKKGGDGGVDGLLYFKPDGKKTEKAIVSVNGGQSLTPAMVKDLIVTVDQEGAKMGIFLTLEVPTKGMTAQAAAAGIYKTEYGEFPKIQIVTIGQLFQPANPIRMPWQDTSVFKKARREKTEHQTDLDL